MQNNIDIARLIANGDAVLGIELGSTRIKAVAIGQDNLPIAQGVYDWENQLVDGFWSYSLDDIHDGLRGCYADLVNNIFQVYGAKVTRFRSIGISGMMHGFMPFDREGVLLTPFRTWRNTNTYEAAHELSSLLNYNIPVRWSVSHLYQAILNGESYINRIDYMTTLAGYIHWKLTGMKVLGIGDASGMFPVDDLTLNYYDEMVAKFDELTSSKSFIQGLNNIFPKILKAGEFAGDLTEAGAKFLDVDGNLEPGIPFCPPEGDAGTGMVATNAVRERTGNVSAGTSSFSMIVLERALSRPYEIIDMVTTPDGHPVAMVHCNSCTSDLNAWVGLFKEFQELMGVKPDMDELFGVLYRDALVGDKDCDGVVSYNFFSGEPLLGLKSGMPMLMRNPNSRFTLANMMRAHLNASVALLRVGNYMLFEDEDVKVDRLTGHGGLFKTPIVGQKILASALNTPISVLETAGEGGAWGVALLAAYMEQRKKGESLADWLDEAVFRGDCGVEIMPDPEDVAGFDRYMENYNKCLVAEQSLALK